VSFSLKITGIKNVENYLKQKNKNTENAISSAMKKVAFFMQGEVKSSIAGRRAEKTSVDTGRFLNSVFTTTTKDTATIFSDLEYSKYLEYGTSRMRARRHFNNSKDRNKPKIKEMIQQEIKKEI
jgi:phage gpG-like protein